MPSPTSVLPPADHQLAPDSSRNSTLPLAPRVASIDIYRGMVMFLMLAEVLHLHKLRDIFSQDNWIGTIAEWIRFNTTHVEWAGCSLHDMIQPSFSFLVGCSMVYSLASRQARGDSFRSMLLHAIFRSFLLVFLGIFLRSLGKPITNFTFDDTLTQIGLGYWLLFLIAQLSSRFVIVAIGFVLAGYWMAFVLYPAPPSDFPYEQFGVPANWSQYYSHGFATHFNKNSNLAWAFDRWWMNLFPRVKPFEFSNGGYATLSFIPTLATMLLGVLAARILRNPTSTPVQRIVHFILSGIALMLLAYGLDASNLCPIVKRIWTPSWTLWSGGICFLWLAGLHWLTDLMGIRKWAFPLTVIGANSIVAYVLSWTLEKPTHDAIARHFGWLLDGIARALGSLFKLNADQLPMLQELMLGALTLVVFWLILFWMYRKRIFVRI